MRIFYIILFALFPLLSSAQSIAELSRKAAEAKNRSVRNSNKANKNQTRTELSRETEETEDPFHEYSLVGEFRNGLSIVGKYIEEKDANVYGVANEEGTLLLPVIYQSIIPIDENSSNAEDNVYRCQLNGKWGIVSNVKGVLLPCLYDELTNEGNGIWQVKAQGRFGYVSLDGTTSIDVKIPCFYESIGGYSTTSPIRATLRGKKGMIDGENNTIIPFNFSSIGNFYVYDDGKRVCWVSDGKKHGIYTSEGHELQKCDIEEAYYVSSDNVRVKLSFTDFPEVAYIHIKRDGMWGILGAKELRTLIPCSYAYISPIAGGKAFFKSGNKWGIVSVQGKTIQPAIYDQIKVAGSTITEGTMPSKAFREPMHVYIGNKVGLLESLGQSLIPVQYDSLGTYSDGMIMAKNDGWYGFLDRSGAEGVPFAYYQAHDFSEGLAAVVNDKDKFLFIDKSGNVVIKPKSYDRVDDFHNGTCKVYRKNKVWEIDKEGKKVRHEDTSSTVYSRNSNVDAVQVDAALKSLGTKVKSVFKKYVR